MQQIVLAIVIVNHRACLRLHGNASLSFHVQLVEELLLAAWLDRPGNFQQAIGECALAMVDVRDDAEVAEAIDRDVSDPPLEVRFDLQGTCGSNRG
jgi:hypothetical protein